MPGKKVFEVRNAAKAAARRSARPFFGHFDSKIRVKNGGKHARSAFGLAQIPMGACVEIELIAEIA